MYMCETLNKHLSTYVRDHLYTCVRPLTRDSTQISERVMHLGERTLNMHVRGALTLDLNLSCYIIHISFIRKRPFP